MRRRPVSEILATALLLLTGASGAYNGVADLGGARTTLQRIVEALVLAYALWVAGVAFRALARAAEPR